jgi:hypothetical protein
MLFIIFIIFLLLISLIILNSFNIINKNIYGGETDHDKKIRILKNIANYYKINDIDIIKKVTISEEFIKNLLIKMELKIEYCFIDQLKNDIKSKINIEEINIFKPFSYIDRDNILKLVNDLTSISRYFHILSPRAINETCINILITFCNEILNNKFALYMNISLIIINIIIDKIFKLFNFLNKLDELDSESFNHYVDNIFELIKSLNYSDFNNIIDDTIDEYVDKIIPNTILNLSHVVITEAVITEAVSTEAVITEAVSTEAVSIEAVSTEGPIEDVVLNTEEEYNYANMLLEHFYHKGNIIMDDIIDEIKSKFPIFIEKTYAITIQEIISFIVNNISLMRNQAIKKNITKINSTKIAHRDEMQIVLSNEDIYGQTIGIMLLYFLKNQPNFTNSKSLPPLSFEIGDVIESTNILDNIKIKKYTKMIIKDIKNYHYYFQGENNFQFSKYDKNRDKFLNNLGLLIIGYDKNINCYICILLYPLIFYKYKEYQNHKDDVRGLHGKDRIFGGLNHEQIDLLLSFEHMILSKPNDWFMLTPFYYIAVDNAIQWRPMLIKQLNDLKSYSEENAIFKDMKKFCIICHGEDTNNKKINLEDNEYIIMSCDAGLVVNPTLLIDEIRFIFSSNDNFVQKIEKLFEDTEKYNKYNQKVDDNGNGDIIRNNFCIYTKKCPDLNLFYFNDFSDFKSSENKFFEDEYGYGNEPLNDENNDDNLLTLIYNNTPCFSFEFPIKYNSMSFSEMVSRSANLLSSCDPKIIELDPNIDNNMLRYLYGDDIFRLLKSNNLKKYLGNIGKLMELKTKIYQNIQKMNKFVTYIDKQKNNPPQEREIKTYYNHINYNNHENGLLSTEVNNIRANCKLAANQAGLSYSGFLLVVNACREYNISVNVNADI